MYWQLGVFSIPFPGVIHVRYMAVGRLLGGC